MLRATSQQAVDWICEGLAPMGEEYVSVMRRGCLEDRWVDWSPNAGKRQGAFSTRVPKDTHPFILMSYTDDIGSMSTLAHELGRGAHALDVGLFARLGRERDRFPLEDAADLEQLPQAGLLDGEEER